jgi:hypothetical protein
MIIMNGRETLDYFLNRLKNNKRIAFARYGDGEYYLMDKKKICANETFETGKLLRKSFNKKGFLVCTAHFDKDFNKLINNPTAKWANTQRYVMSNGKRELYGTGSFMRKDFMNNLQIIPYFFTKKILIVAGYAKEAKEVFRDNNIIIDVYKMPLAQASTKYIEARDLLIKKCKNYDNIIFSCGPIGKVLISDIVDKCNSNLIDFGSMLNVILSTKYEYLKKKWTMSWIESVNIENRTKLFFEAIHNLEAKK